MYDNNLFAVDTTGIQEMGGFEVLPAGLYPAMMVAASRKPTAKNDGSFLECNYQIIEGDMAGKKFTSRLNLWNQNVQAVDIAKRELKSLRVALGLHDQEAQTEAFLNRPVVLNIGVKGRKDDPNKAENNLIAIEAYSGAPATQRAPAQAPQLPFTPPPQQAPQWATAGQMQTGAVGAGGQHPQQAPAFQPNVAKAPPWMAGAR